MHADCPFCGSARAEGRVIKEGTHAYVLLSNPRVMQGHLLVIPKRHIEGRIADLLPEERGEIMGFLAEFQAKILEKVAAGCDIRQNFKPYAQEGKTHVNHMHWHVYPRDPGDEVSGAVDVHHKPLYRDLPQEERERMFALLLS